MTLAQQIAEFIPPLQRWYPITTPYGAATAKGPDAGAPHWGLDFGTPEGTPLYAISDGIVRQPTDTPGGGTAGNTLVIDYGNGVLVLAGHLSDMFVRPGDRVKAGDWIANTGNTGITTGPHLHLQAWRSGQQINPLDLFDWARDGFPADAYSSTHGASVPSSGGADGPAKIPYDNGCPAGYVAQNAFGDPAFPSGMACVREDIANPWMAPIASFTDFISAILNPENWARIFAIFIGFIMTGAGAFMLWQAV